jgi:hypothetical protein
MTEICKIMPSLCCKHTLAGSRERQNCASLIKMSIVHPYMLSFIHIVHMCTFASEKAVQVISDYYDLTIVHCAMSGVLF